jgi:hypothetical protein
MEGGGVIRETGTGGGSSEVVCRQLKNGATFLYLYFRKHAHDIVIASFKEHSLTAPGLLYV